LRETHRAPRVDRMDRSTKPNAAPVRVRTARRRASGTAKTRPRGLQRLDACDAPQWLYDKRMTDGYRDDGLRDGSAARISVTLREVRAPATEEARRVNAKSGWRAVPANNRIEPPALRAAAHAARWTAMTRKLAKSEVAVGYNPDASTLLESRRPERLQGSLGFSHNWRRTSWQPSDIWSPTLSVL
jgi:hypothetical protein